MALSERLKRAQVSTKARQSATTGEMDYTAMAGKTAIELQVDDASAAEIYSKIRDSTSVSNRLGKAKGAGQTEQSTRVSVDAMFDSLGLATGAVEMGEVSATTKSNNSFSLNRTSEVNNFTSAKQEGQSPPGIIQKELESVVDSVDKERSAEVTQHSVDIGVDRDIQVQNKTMGGSTMRANPLGASRGATASGHRRRPRLSNLTGVQATSSAVVEPANKPVSKPAAPKATTLTAEHPAVEQKPVESAKETKPAVEQPQQPPEKVEKGSVEKAQSLELETVQKVESATSSTSIGIVELSVMANVCNVSEQELVDFANKAYAYAIKHGRLKTASKQIDGLAYYTHFVTPHNPPTVVVTLTYGEYAAVIEVNVDDTGYVDLAHKLEVADGIAKIYGVPAALLDCSNKAMRSI